MTCIATSKTLRLEFEGTRIGVRSEDHATLSWLAEFFAPSFVVRRREPSEWMVSLRVDRDAYQDRLHAAAAMHCQELDCFANDGYFSRYPAWPDSGGRQSFHIEQDEVCVTVPRHGREIHVLAAEEGTGHRLTLMRVVRELVSIEQWKQGRLMLHGAAFECGGRGVVICGPKNAGKTTLLVHALTGGCGLIANDRVVVDPTSTRTIVRGMPTIIRIRPGTHAYFPKLLERQRRSGFRRELSRAESRALRTTSECFQADESLPSLSGVQLAQLLNAPLTSSAPIGRIVFPQIDPHAKGIELVALSPQEAAQRLAECILAPCRPWRRPAAFERFTPAQAISEEYLTQQCERLAGRIACFRCVLGTDAYRYQPHWMQPLCMAA